MKRPIALVTLAVLGLASVSLITLITPSSAIGARLPSDPAVSLLASGLEGAVGSTVGPGGALYVTEAIPGRITRVDPETGEKTTFATGLPTRISLSLSAERWTLPSSGTPRTSS